MLQASEIALPLSLVVTEAEMKRLTKDCVSLFW
jgi:hypothetical protein